MQIGENRGKLSTGGRLIGQYPIYLPPGRRKSMDRPTAFAGAVIAITCGVLLYAAGLQYRLFCPMMEGEWLGLIALLGGMVLLGYAWGRR